jgi:hypothetical protein
VNECPHERVACVLVCARLRVCVSCKNLNMCVLMYVHVCVHECMCLLCELCMCVHVHVHECMCMSACAWVCMCMGVYLRCA